MNKTVWEWRNLKSPWNSLIFLDEEHNRLFAGIIRLWTLSTKQWTIWFILGWFHLKSPRKTQQFFWCIYFTLKVYNMSLSPYHDSFSISCIWFYTMSLSQYHDSKIIPWVLLHNLSLSLYHDSQSIPWIHLYTTQ